MMESQPASSQDQNDTTSPPAAPFESDFTAAWENAPFRKEASVVVHKEKLLASQRNATGNNNPANREVVVARERLKDTKVYIYLRRVQHGRLHGKAAVLVALDVWVGVRGVGTSLRMTSAAIKVQLRKRDVATGSSPSTPPPPPGAAIDIAGFCPGCVYGVPTREERKWRFGAAVPVSIGIGPATISPELSANLERSFPRDYRLEISGFREPLGPSWKVTENAVQKSGIPERLTCATLAVYGNDADPDGAGGCAASVSIKVQTNWPLWLQAWPWEADDPVLLVPGQNFPASLPVADFDNLTEADWKQVVDYPTEFQDQFVETFPSA